MSWQVGPAAHPCRGVRVHTHCRGRLYRDPSHGPHGGVSRGYGPSERQRAARSLGHSAERGLAVGSRVPSVPSLRRSLYAGLHACVRRRLPMSTMLGPVVQVPAELVQASRVGSHPRHHRGERDPSRARAEKAGQGSPARTSGRCSLWTSAYTPPLTRQGRKYARSAGGSDV